MQDSVPLAVAAKPSDDIASSGTPGIVSEAQTTLKQAIDVRKWRLPFAAFTFMRETDFFGTVLFTTTLAWAIFYLVAVPATYFAYTFGPAAMDVSALNMQTVANAIFLPAWPACLVVALGVTLLRKQNA